MQQNKVRLKAFATAFPYTIPLIAGIGFFGLAYGVYMNISGFSFWYPLVMSIVIFGGSLEFLAVSLLLAPFAPLQTFILAVMIQARHLFYGIAMLEKFKGLGVKRFYLIYSMCDETFSINYAADVPDDVDRGWFMVFVSLLTQFYWTTSSVLGCLLGSLISFNTEGLDFVMTAVFTVIFLEQLLKQKKPYTAIIGVASSAVCRFFFGANSFLVPTMVCILCLLTLFREPIERAGDTA